LYLLGIDLKAMIPYGRHSINDDDIELVSRALKSDWLTTGPFVEAFESEIEKVTGAKSISVSSGTAALHCAYAAIGIKPGDEIITPPITFIATQATAELLGAKIVFVDVQKDTANIEPNLVAAAITKNTKAIVAVDYAGHPADLSDLRTIADEHGLYLIEDAAHSLGSLYKGKKVGSIADLTTFSFFPTKNITTSEGGAVAAISPQILDRAKKFGRQGLVRDKTEMIMKNEGPWHQEVHEFGLNYRLSDISCALGLSQLRRLPLFKKERKDLFEKYYAILSGIKNVGLPTLKEYVDPMWHLFPIRVPSEYRKQIFLSLREMGVGVQVNYLPAHLHQVYKNKGFKIGDFPISEKFYNEEISLPMMANNSMLNEQYFKDIVEVLKSI